MQALVLNNSKQNLSNINKQKSCTNYTISIPIPIPRSNLTQNDLDLTEQYSLNSNVFNPSKMSPPDNWKFRLEKRLKDFESYTEISNKE